MSWVGIISGCSAVVLGSALQVAVAAPASRSAPSTVSVESCSWNRPGHNPFMGDVVAAVDRYADIPQAVRERMKARMAKREYDEVVSIKRDAIEGRATYDPVIADMHFGVNRMCRSVDRSGWTQAMQERGLVYCESGHCILVPTVCRNVSRITRRAAPASTAGSAGGTSVASSPAQDDPLAFDPPGAGGPVDESLPPTAGGATTLTEEPIPSAPMSGPQSTAPSSFAGGSGGRGQIAGRPGTGGSFAAGSGGGSGNGAGAGGRGGGGGGWSGGTPGGPAPLGPPPGISPGSVGPVTAVPEPTTTMLMLLGLAGLAMWTRRCQAVRAA